MQKRLQHWKLALVHHPWNWNQRLVVVLSLVSVCLVVQLMFPGTRPVPSASPRVGIIGSSGYIGSALLGHLTREGLEVQGFDRAPLELGTPVAAWACRDIPQPVLDTLDVVVYLGGLTGREACNQRTEAEVDQENVQNIVRLAQRMRYHQTLVFASTSAIAEGTGSHPLSETDPIQVDRLDTYSWSMLRREQALYRLARSRPRSAPRMIGLRFGTVVGTSPSQRLDLVHMALVRSAFLDGLLRVTHPESYRAFLWMPDLVRAIHRTVLHADRVHSFEVFHLQSFASSIESVAHAVAHISGVFPRFHSAAVASPGFSLNVTKFRRTFDFGFEGSHQTVLDDLVRDVPTLAFGRELVQSKPVESIPCVVCGSKNLMTVVDLGSQPLANDFFPKPQASPRFPLRLVRCRECHHAQLSHLVDRDRLFRDYKYQSGTSTTLVTHFQWLADKVGRDFANRSPGGAVLELACNDGTQLDQFKARGWKTFGVDPAANLVALAQAKGHTVFTGFWGVDSFVGLPRPIDAMVAQNVLAHVESPFQFLRACAEAMGPFTRLYLQTSQCEMFDSGQVDTVYHEHVSFFTAHSFQHLATRAGLVITDFERVPIHGSSCLVTLQLAAAVAEPSTALVQALQTEVDQGKTGDWFYLKYRAKVLAMRQWLHTQLTTLAAQGYDLVAYGAAAKGMVLLHYLRELPNRSYEFLYVVDDAPLKQGTYCPGTTIPVYPTSVLANHSTSKPLAMVILAWNFLPEIEQKIRWTLTNGTSLLLLVPYPDQHVVQLDLASGQRTRLLSNPYTVPLWPIPKRKRPVVLLTHFYNETLLLPYFIRHHASMFDHAVLVNQGEPLTDIELPPNWRIVPSKLDRFGAIETDEEMSALEEEFPDAWKLVLTVTEFLVHPDLRSWLDQVDTQVVRFRSITMCGSDTEDLGRFEQLIQQRHQFVSAVADDGVNQYSRFAHRISAPGNHYTAGRHGLSFAANWIWAPNGFIAKFQWTPWPQILPRKLQIKHRIPPADVARSFGFQHTMATPESLTQTHAQVAQTCTDDLASVAPLSNHVYTMLRLAWYNLTQPMVRYP